MSRSRLRRAGPFVPHPSEWAILGGLLALALVVVFVLSGFRHSAERNERSESLLVALQTQVGEVEARSWEVVLNGAKPQARDALVVALADGEATLSALVRRGDAVPVLRVQKAWRDVRRAAERSSRFAKNGNISRAVAVQGGEFDLAIRVFKWRARVASRDFHQRHEQVERLMSTATTVAVLLTGLAAAAVAILMGRRRTAAEASARAELVERNARLRELDRMKDEFIALVSHELRTPLTSIRGYLELVLDSEEELTAEQGQLLGVVARNVKRLERLVGDLLFVAQLEAGRLSFDWEELDAVELIEDAVSAAWPVAEGKEIVLETAVDGPLPLIGDRARLGQVLDNLVANAVKFTPQGGTVTVAARADGKGVAFTVTDTGVGIPPDEQAAVFERFYRTRGATEAAVPGTGLGLSIAKAIVEGHGGSIALSSTPGAGTSFRFVVPLARALDIAA